MRQSALTNSGAPEGIDRTPWHPPGRKHGVKEDPLPRSGRPLAKIILLNPSLIVYRLEESHKGSLRCLVVVRMTVDVHIASSRGEMTTTDSDILRLNNGTPCSHLRRYVVLADDSAEISTVDEFLSHGWDLSLPSFILLIIIKSVEL